MAQTFTEAIAFLAKKPLKGFTDRNGVTRQIQDITAMSTPEVIKRQARENEAKKVAYRVHTAPGRDFGKIFRVDKSIPHRTIAIYIGVAS